MKCTCASPSPHDQTPASGNENPLVATTEAGDGPTNNAFVCRTLSSAAGLHNNATGERSEPIAVLAIAPWAAAIRYGAARFSQTSG
jgi:hypothetical protein